MQKGYFSFEYLLTRVLSHASPVRAPNTNKDLLCASHVPTSHSHLMSSIRRTGSYSKRPYRIHIAECQSSSNRLFPRLSRSTCLRLPRIPILPSFVTFVPPLTHRSEVEDAGLLQTLLISSIHLTESSKLTTLVRSISNAT